MHVSPLVFYRCLKREQGASYERRAGSQLANRQTIIDLTDAMDKKTRYSNSISFACKMEYLTTLPGCYD
jgi:hypothetical protein